MGMASTVTKSQLIKPVEIATILGVMALGATYWVHRFLLRLRYELEEIDDA
jgi:hypothetical protein